MVVYVVDFSKLWITEGYVGLIYIKYLITFKPLFWKLLNSHFKKNFLLWKKEF